jgi:hypothetical protein
MNVAMRQAASTSLRRTNGVSLATNGRASLAACNPSSGIASSQSTID